MDQEPLAFSGRAPGWAQVGLRERFLRGSLDAADVGYWEWDLRRGTLDCTSACGALAPELARPCSAREVARLLDPLARREVRRAVRRALTRGEDFRLTCFVPQAGECRQLLAAGRAWHHAETGDTVIAGVLLDVTGPVARACRQGCDLEQTPPICLAPASWRAYPRREAV